MQFETKKVTLMTEKNLRIAVVGGGLGGLASAIALAGAGFEVDVFERAPGLGEVGAGINISPQATKALVGIGVGDRIRQVGIPVTGHVQRSMYTGEQLAETLFTGAGSTSSRYGAPYYVFHRADLLAELADALGEQRLHLGHTCVGVIEHPESVTLEFDNGSRRDFDVVIGADGIHSRIRGQLYGGDGQATYTGQMVWRALVDSSNLPDDILGAHGFYGWIGRGSHLMTYYIRGTDIINITTQTDSEDWVEERWSIAGDPDEMRKCFPGATPDLQLLLDEVTECSKWGLFGRPPSPNWGRGRVQLIGDAAHPMLPNAGQGAAQAFEDAYVLGRWLGRHRDDPVGALKQFRNVRIPRAHAVQRQSWLNSKLVHAGDWESRRAQFEARQATGDTPLGLGWIYEYDPESEWSRRVEYPLSRDEHEGF